MRRTISKKTAKLIKFPSPLGVIYFQIDLKYIIVPEEQFPSPLGVIYFQMKGSYIIAQVKRFPSPLGVIYFQIKDNRRSDTVISGFRLLSELSISKL